MVGGVDDHASETGIALFLRPGRYNLWNTARMYIRRYVISDPLSGVAVSAVLDK
jgi:hypothetical protein